MTNKEEYHIVHDVNNTTFYIRSLSSSESKFPLESCFEMKSVLFHTIDLIQFCYPSIFLAVVGKCGQKPFTIGC